MVSVISTNALYDTTALTVPLYINMLTSIQHGYDIMDVSEDTAGALPLYCLGQVPSRPPLFTDACYLVAEGITEIDHMVVPKIFRNACQFCQNGMWP